MSTTPAAKVVPVTKFATGVVDTGGAPWLANISTNFGTNRKWPLYYFQGLSRESGEEKTKVRPDCSFAPTQLALCLRLAYFRFKRRELLRAVVTLDDSTPQRRISELRVWSYEPFIVFTPSSSGYLSGQYLEVLYIIRNSI